jgi:prophage regulatory protein
MPLFFRSTSAPIVGGMQTKTKRVRREIKSVPKSRTKVTYVALPLPEKGFVRLPSILAVYPISRASWWNGVKSGIYPAAIKLGPGTTVWRAEDIWELLRKTEGA